MSTSISFPYNQTVQAFTPTSGTYANNTFVICATSERIGAGQIQPSSASSNGTSYQCSFPYNIGAGGSSTSTLAFILNEQNGGINQNPPYYFVAGSTGNNLWLHSFTPASSASSFGSGNISTLGKVDSFNTPVASVLYYPPLNLLFVGGNNGNLYTYKVSWNAQGVPSFSENGANKNYRTAVGCAVSLTLAYLTPNSNSPSLIVTGLTWGDQNGSCYFPISSTNNGVLPNSTGVIWGTIDSVATVVDYQNQLVYTATQTALLSHPINNLQSQPTTIWNASKESTPQLILSLAGSRNPNNADPSGQFSKGALFIGTVPASSGASNNTFGSIYTYDPSNSILSLWNDQIPGSPFSIYADQNLHFLVNAGSTGLDFYSLVYKEGTAPQAATLIVNTAFSSQSKSTDWLSVLKVVFEIAEDVAEEVAENPEELALLA
jgi:hypothetical protein